MHSFLFITAYLFLPFSSADSTLKARLRTNDQLLLTGNYAAWAKFTAPDFYYVDEENQVINRSDFLKELEPSSLGWDDPLQISTYDVRLAGRTATVVYRADEKGHVLGSKVDDQYLFTETWQYLGNTWKLRVVHVNAVRTNPPPIPMTSVQMDELVGTYRADSAIYTLRRHADRLIGQRTDRAEVELKAETRDILFMSGNTRIRKVFQRDAQGMVIGFDDHNENRSIKWTRVR